MVMKKMVLLGGMLMMVVNASCTNVWAASAPGKTRGLTRVARVKSSNDEVGCPVVHSDVRLARTMDDPIPVEPLPYPEPTPSDPGPGQPTPVEPIPIPTSPTEQPPDGFLPFVPLTPCQAAEKRLADAQHNLDVEEDKLATAIDQMDKSHDRLENLKNTPGTPQSEIDREQGIYDDWFSEVAFTRPIVNYEAALVLVAEDDVEFYCPPVVPPAPAPAPPVPAPPLTPFPDPQQEPVANQFFLDDEGES